MQAIFGCGFSLDLPIFAGVAHDQAGPALMIDGVAVNQVVRRLLTIEMLPVNLTRLKGRRCTGYYDLAALKAFPCANLTKMATGDGRQCPTCIQRTGFNPAFYNLPESTLSPQQQIYNKTPHAVYLAAFDEMLIKVGITSFERLANRLREQGALSAYLVAKTPDALAARRIEESVARVGRLGESIGRKAKNAALSRGVSLAAIDEALTRECMRLVDQVLLDPLAISSRVTDLSSNRAAAVAARNSFDYSGAQPLAFAGFISGAIGETLLIKSETDRSLLVDSKQLLGHRLSYAEATSGPVGAVQTRLF